MILLETDVKMYEQNSTEGLRYFISGHVICISNRFGEKITELIFSDVAEGIFCDKWFGYLNAEEYKEIMSGALLEYFVRCKCIKKICDTQNLIIGMDAETSVWFKEKFLPILIKAGLQYNAIVIPKNNYARQSMDYFEQNLEHKYAMPFPSFDIAMCWMKIIS